MTVEPCCTYITSKDEGGFSALVKNMTLDEFIDQTLSDQREGDFIINHGPITLNGSPAYKIVGGYKTLDLSNPAFVTVYSIDAAKLFTINYSADPSNYDTYLPGVQKIVDTFRMRVS